MVSIRQLEDLVASPSEGLNEEHKTWLDPDMDHGAAKIVKAIYGLRNRDGGFLLIGLNDSTKAVDPYPFGDPIEQKFHQDTIQGLVSKYANDPFNVETRIVEKDGDKIVVIAVPDGVKSPVAVSKPIADKSAGKELCGKGDLYFRTLNSNGIPSTSKIQPADYPDLLEICFNNKEGDIGRFVRRHLPDLNIDDCLRLKRPKKPTSETEKTPETSTVTPKRPHESLRDRSLSILSSNESRFVDLLTKRGQLGVLDKHAASLTMKVGVAFAPYREDAIPSDEFLNRVNGGNPRYTGWPFWMNTRGFRDASMHPFVSDGAWNELLIDADAAVRDREIVEFYRMDPRGDFYARRVTQDDTAENVRSKQRVMDPFLMIIRVAEVLGTAISVAKSVGWSDEGAAGFAFEWTGLSNRRLRAWANPMRMLVTEGAAHDDRYSAYVEMNLEMPIESLAPYVRRVLQGMFVLFEGFELSDPIYEDLTLRVIQRRL